MPLSNARRPGVDTSARICLNRAVGRSLPRQIMVARFITLGCRLNQAEESELAGAFAGRGWTVVFDDGPADAVIVRSCAVTRRAERDTLQTLRAVKRNCAGGHLPVLAVTGCATTALPRKTLEEAGADIVAVKGADDSLPDAIETFLREGRQPRAFVDVSESGFSFKTPFDEALADIHLDRAASACVIPATDPVFRHARAMLKVQDGCDFLCAYCIVPYTRGHSVSRPLDALENAARRLFERGFRKLAVTGCNLACYRDGQQGLPELLGRLCALAAPFGAEISIGSLEPAICDEGIVETLLEHPNFERRIHLPIQSGDTGVLRLAGRRYGEEEIRRALALYRSRVDGLHLGGDFITGLPGEDEAAFERTCTLVRDFKFDAVHVFPFSPRQGTVAAAAEAVPRAVAKERAARLRALVPPDGACE